jgi:phosphatidylinositol alpha-1,6-mannosyltransferase
VKALLITNDFPPMAGGEAVWYAQMCGTRPPERIIVLAPHVPGDREFDARQPYRIIRAWAPTSPHPLARLVQIIVLFACGLGIARRKECGDIHIGHLYLGVIGLALNRWLHLPYVVYLHGGEMAPYMRFRPIRAVTRRVICGARLVVVNSPFTRRLYETLGMSHPRVEIVLLSPATERFRPDVDPHAARVKYGLDGRRVILTVGRLVERKGHDVVIRALGQVRQSVGPVRYVIAGSGPEEQRLRVLARDLGCQDSVQFVGPVSPEELPLLYASCDVFVMPSRALGPAQRDGVEGFGIVFLEAGACAKPVIGGRSGGIADAVVDGVTGILVDPSDVDEVARTVSRLLLDKEEAGRLGACGRDRAQALERAWAGAVGRVFDGAAAAGDRT